jgi:hypothetical protein
VGGHRVMKAASPPPSWRPTGPPAAAWATARVVDGRGRWRQGRAQVQHHASMGTISGNKRLYGRGGRIARLAWMAYSKIGVSGSNPR